MWYLNQQHLSTSQTRTAESETVQTVQPARGFSCALEREKGLVSSQLPTDVNKPLNTVMTTAGTDCIPQSW